MRWPLVWRRTMERALEHHQPECITAYWRRAALLRWGEIVALREQLAAVTAERDAALAAKRWRFVGRKG